MANWECEEMRGQFDHRSDGDMQRWRQLFARNRQASFSFACQTRVFKTRLAVSRQLMLPNLTAPSRTTGGVVPGRLACPYARSEQPGQFRGREPFPLGEVEVAAVADLEHGGLLAHILDALVLIVEVDVDVQLTAQPALVGKGPSDM